MNSLVRRAWGKLPIMAMSILILMLMGSVSRAEEPPTKPMLRIETGMHNTVIKDLAVDKAETIFVTGSQDGTLRVWDLSSGDLRQTLRLPSGPGDGQIYSLAITPDGKTVVCGGTTGFVWDKTVCIYFFDLATGKITRRITGLPNATQSLRFSPNGEFLAVGMASNEGLRVFRTADGKQVAADKEYDADCINLAFRSDGVLAASGLDGFIRLYEPNFKLALRKKAPGGTHPHGLDFNPEGTLLAVGFGDSKTVNVLSATDLTLKYSPGTDDLKLPNMAFDEVVWSQDGKQLFGGGRAAVLRDNIPYRMIRRWDSGGKGAFKDIPASMQTITAIHPLKSGDAIFTTGAPSWGVIDKDGARSFTAPVVDWRLCNLLISKTGDTVQFAYEGDDKSTSRFYASQRKLDAKITDKAAEAAAKAKADNLQPSYIKTAGMDITGVEGGMHPKVNGKAVEVGENEMSRCVALVGDLKQAVIGSDFAIRLVDDGGKVLWMMPVPAAVWQVNVSADGRIGVAALGDGTLRWFLVKDATLMLSVFLHADQKRWVAWSPSGYYDASHGSEDLIGWHINRGKEQAADFFPASRFRSTYYRPDVLDHILTASSEEDAVKVADNDRGKKTEVVDVVKLLPPLVTILSPDNNSEVSASAVKVQFTVRSPEDAPVTSVRALVDGRPVSAPRKIVEAPTDAGKDSSQSLDVTLPQKDCELSIIAENKNGISAPSVVKIHWKGKAPDDITKPKLYVLSIGVSKYKNPEYTLNYAAKDATDFAALLKLQKGKLYRDVEERVITDDAASKDSVLDSLEWIQKQTTSRDVAMIFLSGHGVKDGSGDYYYVPYDFNIEKKRSTGILFYEIEKTIKDIAGKVVFFVDTCHSGGAAGKARGVEPDINSIVNELSSVENGAVVFAASTGKEFALEDPKWGHGAFTSALLEGLSGKADLKGDGRITLLSLDYYLSERVKELTDGGQHPTTTKPPSVPDFPLAISK